MDIKQNTINERIKKLLSEKFPGTSADKSSNFELERNKKDEEVPDKYGWKRPLYSVWSYGKKSNEV